MTVALVKYDAARRALAAANSVDEVKDIRDKAEAMRAYARQAKDIELETWAAEIKLRASRRIGEISKTLESSPGQRTDKPLPASGKKSKRSTLKSAGISTSAAHRYEEIAGIPEEAFDNFIAQKRQKKQPAYAQEVVKAVKNAERRQAAEQETGAHRTDSISDLAALADSGQQFKAIYVDPPWTFKVYSGKGKSRSAENHYDTMDQATIETLALYVEKLAAKDCVLFLWSVMPQLPEALKVMEAWGFAYKTAGFTWAKLNKSGEGYFMGMGYWTRANAELCLLATRGNPKRIHADVPQLIVAPVGEHSRKPDETRGRIERLVSGPYLELFARQKVDGWTVWGNQAGEGI